MSDANGYVKLYHPRGVLVTLPVCGVLDYGAIFKNVAAAFDAGFLVTAPGLEEGEEKREVGWVVRCLVSGRNNGTADMLMLYAATDDWVMPFLNVYLNTDAAREAFEHASGMRLAGLTEYVGEGRLERGNPKFAKLIHKAPQPFTVIYGPNPKWKATEADKATTDKPYTVAKKKFRRWEKEMPAMGEGGEHILMTSWHGFCNGDPSLADFNQKVRDGLTQMPTGQLKEKVWALCQAHAVKARWKWCKESKAFQTQ